ncbi:MAG: hypothetical protein CVU00_06365 [Bacteroidetes bacterium HGW-Bacteroidetes-17]|jgi:hypothetical protein|nr:MAG: hypothetical protein CVU00_06365 [Bacteroidetes bacterium HGW-Bacteroidetes-17]
MKGRIFTLIIFLSFTMLCLNTCKKTGPCDDGVKGSFKNLTGLDGCGWVIVLEDNNQVIEPSNLNDFMIVPSEDKKIWVKYERAPLASICMVGEVVIINCISDR